MHSLYGSVSAAPDLWGFFWRLRAIDWNGWQFGGNPEKYEKGYQTLQGLFAIGSGGLFGRGLGASVQKLGFVPEAQNDMIFSIVCEELGLVGASFYYSFISDFNLAFFYDCHTCKRFVWGR